MDKQLFLSLKWKASLCAYDSVWWHSRSDEKVQPREPLQVQTR